MGSVLLKAARQRCWGAGGTRRMTLDRYTGVPVMCRWVRLFWKDTSCPASSRSTGSGCGACEAPVCSPHCAIGPSTDSSPPPVVWHGRHWHYYLPSLLWEGIRTVNWVVMHLSCSVFSGTKRRPLQQLQPLHQQHLLRSVRRVLKQKTTE